MNEIESIRKKRPCTKDERERDGKGRVTFKWKPKKRIRFQLDECTAATFTFQFIQAAGKLPIVTSKFLIILANRERTIISSDDQKVKKNTLADFIFHYS